MRLGKRLLVVGALLCLVIVSTGVIRAAGSGNDARARETSTGYPKRAVLTDIEKWSSGCRNGFCEETDFPAVQLTTSPAIGRVDVTFTATVDFRTTRDDWGSFAAELDSDTGHRTMPPGTLRVVSPSSTLMTTTTLVWAVRRLPARGRTYNFLLGAAGHDGDGNGVGRIYGRHVTLVRDVWVVGGSARGTVAEHWDGHAWTLVRTHVAGAAWLNGVAAVGTNDVWAVGGTPITRRAA